LSNYRSRPHKCLYLSFSCSRRNCVRPITLTLPTTQLYYYLHVLRFHISCLASCRRCPGRYLVPRQPGVDEYGRSYHGFRSSFPGFFVSTLRGNMRRVYVESKEESTESRSSISRAKVIFHVQGVSIWYALSALSSIIRHCDKC
jgi:hypothetical protein